ncbi:hypothetical protein [Methanococcus voltae]|uniref:Uncharacterized protein n=1 Tax=Methanococcus voltae (strain ATCC BAA-1334 / A3) TaxID=456320 RepID=D7DSV2_METV3|nr:hypothetical protein [Methanococcus voltae]MCS3901812.1 hypothetical protein [Methanococcus voltae]
MNNNEKYNLVICSTLNQYVNYNIIQRFCENKLIDKIYNITFETNSNNLHNNNRWDKNLKEVIKNKNLISEDKIIDIIISDDKIGNIDLIIKCFNRLEDDLNDHKKPKYDLSKDENKKPKYDLSKDEKLIWNITGGQRSTVMAIHKFIKENNRNNDLLCYLEGNMGDVKLLKVDYSKPGLKVKKLFNQNYDENLTIEDCLKLAGFRDNDNKNGNNKNNDTKEEPFNMSDDEISQYGKLYDLYIKNQELREYFINSNKQGNNLDFSDDENNEFKKLINNEEVFKKLKEDWSKKPKGTVFFGYILEKMVYAVLYNKYHKDEEKNTILEMKHSYKINFANKEDIVDGHQIDEFDIILLTKKGKLIIIECKSGGMSGDVAKSHNYSTYATCGVYGLPILINPLTDAELGAIHTKDSKGTYAYLFDKDYEYIRSAYNSARRAGLEVIGIDKLTCGNNILKKYLK